MILKVVDVLRVLLVIQVVVCGLYYNTDVLCVQLID